MGRQERETQAAVDRFYAENGPCCAGCDWWRWINAGVGECIRHAPNPAHDASAGLGFDFCSLPRVNTNLTVRSHYCGDFEDQQG